MSIKQLILVVLTLVLGTLTGCEQRAQGVQARMKGLLVAHPASALPRCCTSLAAQVESGPATQPNGQVCCALILSTSGNSEAGRHETLAQVLVAAGIKPPAETVTELNRPISSYAALNDHDIYLIAYYLDSPSGMLEDPLRVLSFSSQSRQWRTAQLALGGDQIAHSECVGSVLGAYRVATAFLLETHINPSASCSVILDENLAFRGVLFGWYLATLSKTEILFQRSEVHFTAVHPLELALYDIKSNQERPLFPRKPFQRIRADYVAKLSEFYRAHVEWCEKNNHPCDPESVDSTLDGEVAVNDHEQALAFIVSYEDIQQFVGPAAKPEGPGRVVYVYRHLDDEATLDYREMLLAQVEKRFGKRPLNTLLEPAALQEIFARSSQR